jgi:uncharacterized protein (TIGR02271 family)
MAHITDNGNASPADDALVGARVTDAEGHQASVVSIEQRDGAHEAQAWLRADSGAQLLVPLSLLTRETVGMYRLPMTFGPATNEGPVHMTIPVVEEQMHVDKRWVETERGVRIRKTVTQQEQRIEQPLLREQLDVEHVPVGRLLTDADVPQTRYEGDTLVVPVLEEVLVVQKQLRLKEEVRITRRQYQETVPHTEHVRVEQVTVEHFGNEGRA